MIKKFVAYIMLGDNLKGCKEVLRIQIGENNSAKCWLNVLNELNNREVKDMLMICANEFMGTNEAISVTYPDTEYQCCVVN